MSKEYEPQTVKTLTKMAQMGLSKWGMGPDATAKLINLSENATFMATDPNTNRQIVVRMQRSGYSSPEAIRSEMAFINSLVESHVVDTAKPQLSVDGDYIVDLALDDEHRQAVAFERLSGKEPDLEQKDLAYWFEKLGAITARLHQHAKIWQRPQWFTRRRWDYEGIIGEHAFWGPWQASLGLDDEGEEIFAKTLEIVKPQVLKFGTAPDRFGIIHGDMRATNLLVDGEKLQVIDFDDMGFGYYMFDFGAALSFMEQSPDIDKFARSWVNGYESVHRLSDEERSMLPTFSILRRIELCAWCASHSEVPYAADNGVQITHDTVDLCRKYLQGEYLSLED